MAHPNMELLKNIYNNVEAHGFGKFAVNLFIIICFPATIYLIYTDSSCFKFVIFFWVLVFILWLIFTRTTFSETKDWIPIVSSLSVILTLIFTFYGFYIANDVWNITKHKEVLVAGELISFHDIPIDTSLNPVVVSGINEFINKDLVLRYKLDGEDLRFVITVNQNVFHEYTKIPVNVDTLYIENPDSIVYAIVPKVLRDVNGTFKSKVKVGQKSSETVMIAEAQKKKEERFANNLNN